MAAFLRGLLAVVLGFIFGSVVNMGLITVGGKVIPPPPGADVTTMEGLKASMHLFERKHFATPFLAHAVGTLVGAFVAGLLSPGRSAIPAFVVGGLFLLGGIASVFMLPAPAWYNAIDLLFCYVPMAWLGQFAARRVRADRPQAG